ncbi:collagen alpha-1(I) chain-like [Penaeus vannamei]|uniref:collagen alpha-1(I) chain-like n=1 Tax=Penaeus vannamei TaxID=6689 RepID=UPI00387F7F79
MTTADTGGGGAGLVPPAARSASWPAARDLCCARFGEEIRGTGPTLPRLTEEHKDGAQTPKRHHTPGRKNLGEKEEQNPTRPQTRALLRHAQERTPSAPHHPRPGKRLALSRVEGGEQTRGPRAENPRCTASAPARHARRPPLGGLAQTGCSGPEETRARLAARSPMTSTLSAGGAGESRALAETRSSGDRRGRLAAATAAARRHPMKVDHPVVVGAGRLQPTQPRGQGRLGPEGQERQPSERRQRPGEARPSDGPGSQDPPKACPAFGDGSRRAQGFLAAAEATTARARRLSRLGPRPEGAGAGEPQKAACPGARPNQRDAPAPPTQGPDRPRPVSLRRRPPARTAAEGGSLSRRRGKPTTAGRARPRLGQDPPKPAPLSGTGAGEAGASSRRRGPRPPPPLLPGPRKGAGAGEPKPPARGEAQPAGCPRNARAKAPTGPDGEFARPPASPKPPRWFPYSCRRQASAARPQGRARPRGATEGSPSTALATGPSLRASRDGSRRGEGFLAGGRGHARARRSLPPPPPPSPAPRGPPTGPDGEFARPPASPQPPKVDSPIVVFRREALSPHDRGQGSVPRARKATSDGNPAARTPKACPAFAPDGEPEEARASSRRRGHHAPAASSPRPERAEGGRRPNRPPGGRGPAQQDAPATTPAQGPRPAPTASLPPAPRQPEAAEGGSPYSCRRGPSAHARPRAGLGPGGHGSASPSDGPGSQDPQSLPRFRGRDPERQGLHHGGETHAPAPPPPPPPTPRAPGQEEQCLPGGRGPASRMPPQRPPQKPRRRACPPAIRQPEAAEGGFPYSCRAGLSAPRPRAGLGPEATEGSPSDGKLAARTPTKPAALSGTGSRRRQRASRPRRWAAPAPAASAPRPRKGGAGSRKASRPTSGGSPHRPRKATARPRAASSTDEARRRPPAAEGGPPIVVGAGPHPATTTAPRARPRPPARRTAPSGDDPGA